MPIYQKANCRHMIMASQDAHTLMKFNATQPWCNITQQQQNMDVIRHKQYTTTIVTTTVHIYLFQQTNSRLGH